MSTTFEQAQAIVKKQLKTGDVVADWGQENSQWWEIPAGDERYIVQFDDEYMSYDDVCHLVSKADGKYRTMSFASNMDFFDDFKPYGDIPAFFQ
jgi:hypothetical protein